MSNAKREFIGEIVGKVVLCATIDYVPYYLSEEEHINCRLKKGYTQADLEKFLETLDFNYDSGYGSQEVYGTIWFTDGSWSERFEYDGSEHWSHKYCPTVDDDLL